MQTVCMISVVPLLFSMFALCAAAADEPKVIATFTVHVTPASETRQFPRVELMNDKRSVILGKEENGQTLEVPVGTYIFLRFAAASGVLGYVVNPPRGVLESPAGVFHMPKDVIGLLQAVNAGTATITIERGLSKLPDPLLYML